jgi:hypothetical protein
MNQEERVKGASPQIPINPTPRHPPKKLLPLVSDVELRRIMASTGKATSISSAARRAVL